MGKVASNTLKDWQDGQTMNAADYKKERDLIVTANNDTHDRFLDEQSTLQTLENTVNTNENTRQSNETTRQSNENTRISSENTRISNENTRETNETSRASAENTRATNESTRQTNESTRQSNESTRESNESTRQTNEQQRQQTVTELEGATENANTAASSANNAATSANNAASNATTQANYAKSQGDYAKAEADRLVNTDVSSLDVRVTDVETNLSLQDRQKKTLVHGLNIIESDQASNMNVEFYGITRTNHTGREGGFHEQGKWDTDLTIDTSDYKFGTSSGKIDNSGGTSGKYSYNKQKMHIDDKYMIVGLWIKGFSGTPSARIYLRGYDSGGAVITDKFKDFTVNSTWNFYYFKCDLKGITNEYWEVILGSTSYGTADDVVNFDGLIIQELTSTQYNEIGVSWTDEDVERMFPYVDGIKGVKHPVIKVEGQQLFNIHDVSLHENAEITDPRTITLNATGDRQSSNYERSAMPNQTYHIKSNANDTTNTRVYIHELDENEATLITHSYLGDANASFTTQNNTKKIRVELFAKIAGTFTFSDIMLNLGDTALPYVDYNPSRLIAETTLYGNDNEKDILRKNVSLDVPRWEKTKNFEDMILDGNLDWMIITNYTGYKRVQAPVSNAVDHSQKIEKFDGTIMKDWIPSPYGLNVGYVASNSVNIMVSNEETGWLDGMTPSRDIMRAYFNGWKYTGDGTTHSWQAINGTTTETNIAVTSTTQSPTIQDETIKNYFLLYQLATSVVEPVTVEGDLSIQSSAQVEVSEGVIVREEVTPVYYSTGKEYHINSTFTGSSSYLNYKTKRIVGIYKNGTLDEKWGILSNYAFGEQRAIILQSDYDTTATYTVTYEILDKYDFTTNSNEVKATYNKTMKSSLHDVVAKQSDIATQTSINKNSIVEIYAVLKENNLM